MVAARTKGLRVLSYDVELEALRMLADRREELTRIRVRTVNRLQRLLSGLVPGKAKRDITALQARAILASVRPRDLAGKTRRRLAVEQLTELVAVEKKIKTITKELKALVLARGSMDLPGVGPVVAARILADVGDVARFADRKPVRVLDRHRTPGRPLRRAGPASALPCRNRKMNHMLHIAAATQVRLDTDSRGYYRRKLARSKTRMEAMRCLKRRISDAVTGNWSRTLEPPRTRALARVREGTARGVSRIQRGRPAPAHRHFGSATSRTRETDATTHLAPREEDRCSCAHTGPLTTEGSRMTVLVSAGVRNAGDPDGRCANAVLCRTLRRTARPEGVVERGGTSRAGVTGWAPRSWTTASTATSAPDS